MPRACKNDALLQRTKLMIQWTDESSAHLSPRILHLFIMQTYLTQQPHENDQRPSAVRTELQAKA